MNIIFDLDGTISNCEHRRHLVSRDRKDPLWTTFFMQCGKDTAIEPMVEVFRSLVWQNHDVRIWSGRKEMARKLTVAWLLDWVTAEAARFQRFEHLRMRPDDDNQPDDTLKEQWLYDAINNGWTPELVFDDRQKVVDMWRRNHIMCAQVAEGNF